MVAESLVDRADEMEWRRRTDKREKRSKRERETDRGGEGLDRQRETHCLQ